MRQYVGEYQDMDAGIGHWQWRNTVFAFTHPGYDVDDIGDAAGLDLVIAGIDDTAAAGANFEWDLPLVYSDEYSSGDIVLGGAEGTLYVPAVSGVAVFAVMGGLLAAMWPCLFQLTAYFIPAMAGMSMQ